MLKNIILTFFTRGFIALLNFAVLLTNSRYLGSEVVGEISLLVLNIAIIQMVNETFTGPALVHFIPKYDLRRLYVAGLVWTALCSVVLNAAFLFFRVGLEELWHHVFFLSLIQSANAFHVVILLGREKLRAYNFMLFFQPAMLLTVLCISVFILRLQTVFAYLIALYAASFCSLIISYFLVIGSLTERAHATSAFSIRAILKNGVANQLGNLAHTLSNRFNYYILGSIALVGLYANATSLIESVWIVSGSVSPVILSYIANQKHSSGNAALTFYLSKICFVLSCFCVGLIALLPDAFFVFLLGSDFAGIKSVMLKLSPGILAISFVTVISHYFSALALQRVSLLANGLGLLTTLGLSHFLISRYGVEGACYTASVSYIVAATVFIFVFMRMNHFKTKDLFTFRSGSPFLKNRD